MNIYEDMILRRKVKDLTTFPLREIEKEYPLTVEEAIKDIGDVLDFLLEKELKRCDNDRNE